MEPTVSGLCCQVNPRGRCHNCGIPLCSDCHRIREDKKKQLGKRDVWKNLLPGFKPCTHPPEALLARECVFDGHFF